VTGKYGIPLPIDKTARPNIPFDELSEAAYDIVVLTGGHEAPDRVRQDKKVLAFVHEMDRAGKVVAGLCHGPWIMISAQVLRGRTVCAYIGMLDDMVNAGANVVDADVVSMRILSRARITARWASSCRPCLKWTKAFQAGLSRHDQTKSPSSPSECCRAVSKLPNTPDFA
jgi:putative intracellular protease/amidase